MDSLRLLNNTSKGFGKLNQLQKEKRYKIINFKIITTRFGDAVLVNLLDEGDVILPKRFNNLKDNLDELNENLLTKDIYLVIKNSTSTYLEVEFIE